MSDEKKAAYWAREEYRLGGSLDAAKRLGKAEDQATLETAIQWAQACRHLYEGHVRPFEPLSPRALLAAYQRTDGEPSNAEADALLAEINRRELGV